MDSLLPRRVQEVMTARRITLYWVDTTEQARLWESPDHLGYWTVCELLHHVGGTVLPSETFSQNSARARGPPRGSGREPPGERALADWLSALPADSTLNRLLHRSPEYEAAFPRMEGTLVLPVAGEESREVWTVLLEPLAMQQRHFERPVKMFLQGTVARWSPPASSSVATDSWVLLGLGGGSGLCPQLVSRLTAEDVHLVVSVDPGEGRPASTGVISPVSVNAALLTVFRPREAQLHGLALHTERAESARDAASRASEVSEDVLRHIHSSPEGPAASAPPVPEWAQQELGRSARWSPAVLESWFPRSDLSGASAGLMESFWLLQAASSDKEEPSPVESEFTRCLSEHYQRRSREEPAAARQEDGRRKRAVPRTPVRQKMNTMCRSLKMLNVARLNVKAQKSHPDGSPEATGEKGPQKVAGARAAERVDSRGRVLRSSRAKEFKTEEELLSYLQESYQRAVSSGEVALCACAQSLVSAVAAFVRSTGTQEVEVRCQKQIKKTLLKTSTSLRQNIGKSPARGDQVRECQLQVLLRLEMCLQCPAAQGRAGDAECVVEEVAALLRIVCLTEDLASMAGFLEEVLGLYIDAIPKMLGELYDSLGLAIPQKLASVLPADFFGDDSLTQQSKSPLLSEALPSHAGPSAPAGAESDQLEELRTRSAQKRRKNALIRHKSIADVSQNLRQIEIPKVPKRATKAENRHPALQQAPLPGKETGQEVTKVRRNLFNEETMSPSKRPPKQGLLRSQSVSAVEGLRCKPGHGKTTKGDHRLLTKSVAETPVHKQVTRRLLHRQIQGRSSDPGPETDVVEESPEKGDHELGLRRSPRIKQLSISRTSSGSFYSVSQPKSRSVQRARASLRGKSGQRENSPVQSIQSPKRLFFGAVSEAISPSEKGSARMKRPSENAPVSERPTAYQTPKKTSRKSPGSSKATPRRFPCPPQSPQRTPERPQSPPTEATPARCALRTPPRAASSGRGPACTGAPPSQRHPHPPAPGAARAEEPAGKSEDGGVGTPQRPGDTALTSLPASPRNPLGDVSQKSPYRGSAASPAPRDLAGKGPHPAASVATSCSCPVPLTPPRTSQNAKSDSFSPRPPSEVGTRDRQLPEPAGRFQELSPGSPAAPGVAVTSSPAAAAGAAEAPAEAGPSPRPAQERPSPSGSGSGSRRPSPSPLPAVSTMEPLALLDEAERGDQDSFAGSPSPAGSQGPGADIVDAETSLSQQGSPPSPRWGPSSPRTPSCALHGASDRRWCQAASPPGGLQAAASRAPSSSRTYEVELQVRASGLPTLRIKKVEPGSASEAEPPGSGESATGEEGAGPGAPRDSSKLSSKPEPTYLSPPCLQPLHSTPGKGGGQTYICQSCTNTCCPTSTPSPFQTDGVPWSPSPKRSGKTTPDPIRDWPRRKRAGGAALLPSEGKGPDLESSASRTPILGDFEFEGVCQLPEQSPPWDGLPRAEEATWGQVGLGSRKRLLCAREEAECPAKRACGSQREGLDAHKREDGPPAPVLDDAVFASGCTPPPGCTVRSGLSASGLQALTQSPLLFQGKTPTRHADGADADVDAFPPEAESPFSRAFSRTRPVGRTYTRKKLIS
ncbi:PREDICTED: treslin [Condylura cristata]|uniref:treslin n=1 Tax=Condylura cristata TaxID=143302 RepID=UPI0003344498|nr:PREDICTED: treslin [Condylura cristata]